MAASVQVVPSAEFHTSLSETVELYVTVTELPPNIHILPSLTIPVCEYRFANPAFDVACVQVLPSDEDQESFRGPLVSFPPITHIWLLNTTEQWLPLALKAALCVTWDQVMPSAEDQTSFSNVVPFSTPPITQSWLLKFSTAWPARGLKAAFAVA